MDPRDPGLHTGGLFTTVGAFIVLSLYVRWTREELPGR